MPSFASPERRASQAVARMQEAGTVTSLGTARNYEAALRGVAEWLQAQRAGDLRYVTPEQAMHYLAERAEQVGQSQLDQDRQALQAHLGQSLERIVSEREQALGTRAYTDAQVAVVAEDQRPHNALATAVAREAGLRAHELHTLRPAAERPAHERNWAAGLHAARGEVARYTVVGKGGLVREVALSRETAARLEAARRPAPATVYDRGIRYVSHYRIGGGNAWSQSFSTASRNELGWSHGAHGLRHSYAQQRLEQLQRDGQRYRAALAIVSNEMGHHRPEITEVYLR